MKSFVACEEMVGPPPSLTNGRGPTISSHATKMVGPPPSLTNGRVRQAGLCRWANKMRELAGLRWTLGKQMKIKSISISDAKRHLESIPVYVRRSTYVHVLYVYVAQHRTDGGRLRPRSRE